ATRALSRNPRFMSRSIRGQVVERSTTSPISAAAVFRFLPVFYTCETFPRRPAVLPSSIPVLLIDSCVSVAAVTGGRKAEGTRMDEPLVLVVDDRPFSRDLVATELAEAGFHVVTAGDGDEAWAKVQRRRFDLIVTDLRMPRSDGMALLRRVRSAASRHPRVPVILVSAYGTLSTAVEAGKAGATDFYPLNDAGVARVVERAREVLSRARPVPPVELAGESAVMADVRERVEALAALHTPLLIRGEPGTGRRALAEYAHRLGPLAARPFAAVDASAEPGPSPHPQTGVVYLADVDRLPATGQAYWKSLLQKADGNGEALPLRVIASSRDDLRALGEQGAFDAELGRRLATFTVPLPPLRDRLEDLPSLVAALIDRIARRLGRHGARLGPGALERLAAHAWPGNLAELREVIETLVGYSGDGEISAERVAAELLERAPLTKISLERERAEREQLLALYREHGTFSGVARALGITRNAAKYRFARHHLLPMPAGRQAPSAESD
ncbi:MAG: sigma-54-dependent Fis family transcriptional regulator, partial [Deltaproteobacteria bacterium]